MNTETTNLITVNASEFGIEETKANELTSGLKTILEEREVLIENYKEVISLEIKSENIPLFRELRLRIRDNRTKGIEKWHKVNKEFFLTGGRFVDAIKNKEIAENERMEQKLMEGEKHFENLEKERLEKLQAERIKSISPYVEDTTGLNLSGMEDDVWDAYLATKKKQYEDKIEAERKAEEERIEQERLNDLERERRFELAPYAQFITENPELRVMSNKDYDALKNSLVKAKKAYEKEQEAIKSENERLKKQAEEERAKQEKLEAERKEKEERERKEREAEEAKKAAEQAKKDAEYQAQLRKEREAREKLEAEQIAIKEAKEKEDAKRKAESEKLAKAPVKQKMKVWVKDFRLPETDAKNDTEKLIREKFESFKKWAETQIESI